MKKQIGKLTLSRETLINCTSNTALRCAVGGEIGQQLFTQVGNTCLMVCRASRIDCTPAPAPAPPVLW
jgi:hypothetical protein